MTGTALFWSIFAQSERYRGLQSAGTRRPWGRAHGKTTVVKMTTEYVPFTKPRDSLSCSQEPTTGSDLEPDQSTPSRFPTKILWAFLAFPCVLYVIPLDMIAIIFGEVPHCVMFFSFLLLPLFSAPCSRTIYIHVCGERPSFIFGPHAQ
jgi:hypothetical protein